MSKKIYQVFVSSTYTDLKDERWSIIDSLLSFDCIPAAMEFFSASDDGQFEYIKRIMDISDYYLLILGGRYGTLAPDGVSYTEKEYQYAKDIGLEILVLIIQDPSKLPPDLNETKQKQIKKYKLFRKEVSKNRIVTFWDSPSELPKYALQALHKAFRDKPTVGWIRGDQVASDEYIKAREIQTEEKIRKLLEAASSIDDIDDLIELAHNYRYNSSDSVVGILKKAYLTETNRKLASLTNSRIEIEKNDGYYHWLTNQTYIARNKKCTMYALSRMKEQYFFNVPKERVYYQQMLQARIGKEINDNFDDIIKSDYTAIPSFSVMKRIFVTTKERLEIKEVQEFYITYIRNGFVPYMCFDDNKNRYLDFFGEGFLLFEYEDNKDNIILVDISYPPEVEGYVYNSTLILDYFKQNFNEYTAILGKPLTTVEEFRYFLKTNSIHVNEEAFCGKYNKK
jgi:hypothetical protein